jgi:hypothetical protein
MPPHLYAQPALESPVRGEPDDLLLLAGYGFAGGDAVVYRAIDATAAVAALDPPNVLPTHSDAAFGMAPIVSTADIPYSLTVRLPQILHAGQAYALWVRSAGGEWSNGVRINDARPLWISPAFVYSSAAPASLPHEVKIIGRNLGSAAGHPTQVQLLGPQKFTATAVLDPGTSPILNDYVARVHLPEHLAPGSYRVLVNRDGLSWVALEGQSLEVRPDPVSVARFAVSEPRFGGCRPDDGADDTECILAAIAAAKNEGGGMVYFGPGTWDLIDPGQVGVTPGQGIVVPAGVRLRGAGSEITRLSRHSQWNQHGVVPALTLEGRTTISGFTFRDLQVYRGNEQVAPFLKLGGDYRPAAGGTGVVDVVRDVIITQNVFDKPMVAIGSAGLPIERLFVTYNIFGAYLSAIELAGNRYDTQYQYRIDDSVIDHDIFEPGSNLDLVQKSGAIATELGAAHRVDFSDNSADGSSTEYLYSRDDARGWRAAFFWNLQGNVEELLVSHNAASCTGDKIGDGEAISFDNNANTFPFQGAATVARADAEHVAVAAPLTSRQNGRDVPAESYYIGHWVQIVSGPGLGQARRIVGYSTNSATKVTTFDIAPAWDVVPAAQLTRISVGREFWQLYVLDNQVDNRRPLCQKSNRSRRVAGGIGMWAQSADSVIAANHQYDSDGIFLNAIYRTPEHPCQDCTMSADFLSSMDVRANVVDGEYDWDTDCSVSGISVGVAAAPWESMPPPTVGFGISISHNTIRRADSAHSGAIAQVDTWYAGPAPQRWPLSDNLLIHHNVIEDIAGARAGATCGWGRARLGIAFPDQEIAWRTVLYANSCNNVTTPLGPGGKGTVKVCPSSAPNSCECATPAQWQDAASSAHQ